MSILYLLGVLLICATCIECYLTQPRFPDSMGDERLTLSRAVGSSYTEYSSTSTLTPETYYTINKDVTTE